MLYDPAVRGLQRQREWRQHQQQPSRHHLRWDRSHPRRIVGGGNADGHPQPRRLGGIAGAKPDRLRAEPVVNSGIFPVPNNTFYGRAFVYYAGSMPQAHFTLFAAYGPDPTSSATTYMR